MKTKDSHARTGEFQKVGENLYRYSSNAVYYAVFRHRGKLKWKSLKTTDKAIAKRRLTEELKKASQVDPRTSRSSVTQLVKMYEEGILRFDKKTIQTRRSIASKFKATWQFGLEMPVSDVNPVHLEAWLGLHRERLKKATYNEYIRFLRQLFENAVKSRIIAESPAASLVELKREKPIRTTPTLEQLQAIVANIRQLKVADVEDSADLIEFMGLAGVGTAEANSLQGEHINFQTSEIQLYRSKTDLGYKISIFPQVRPLLEKLRDAGQIVPGKKVFRVREPKKALKNACKRLKFPHFSPRSLRRCFITRAVELGVDFKTIAAWQGHSDGGVLIARTYSHLRDSHAKNMATLMMVPPAKQATPENPKPNVEPATDKAEAIS